MSHKTLISGTVYEISGGKTLISGTAYEISGGKTLVNGTAYDVSFVPCIGDPVFANNTWETIIAACQSGKVHKTWAVGDQKTMTINGVNYTIDIIGKNHDTYVEGGTAPLTFQLHELYATKYQMNSSGTNSGGYDSSLMHTTHLPAILNLMPSAVKNAIRLVNKQSTVGDRSATLETIPCKLFLLSEWEVCGKAYRSAAQEGSKYDYYPEGAVGEKPERMKYLSGSAFVWWLRGPAYHNTENFTIVSKDGSSSSGSASYSYGVAPGFCF